MPATIDEIETALDAARLVAIVRLSDHSHVLEIVETLCEAGVVFLEITVERPEGFDSLRRCVATFGEHVSIGAGTVLSVESVQRVAGVGAQFVIAPNTDTEVLDASHAAGLLVVPGAFSPSEVATATAAGARYVKLFPALAGPTYLRALRGPFPWVKFVPTGGVSSDNASEWFDAGASAVAMGSSLVPLSGSMDGLASRAKHAVEVTSTRVS